MGYAALGSFDKHDAEAVLYTTTLRLCDDDVDGASSQVPGGRDEAEAVDMEEDVDADVDGAVDVLGESERSSRTAVYGGQGCLPGGNGDPASSTSDTVISSASSLARPAAPCSACCSSSSPSCRSCSLASQSSAGDSLMASS